MAANAKRKTSAKNGAEPDQELPPAEAVEVAESPAPAPEINGILVHRAFDGNGDLSLQIQTLGDVRKTEILTVLESAIKTVRKSMSLD